VCGTRELICISPYHGMLYVISTKRGLMMFVDLMIKGDVDILISGINRVRLKGWYLPVYMQ
jgi:hypothetical protein